MQLNLSQFILSTILLLSLGACAPRSQQSCGFVQNVYGERISWKGQLPIQIEIHQSVPSIFVPAIEKAASTWEQAAGKKLFQISRQQIGGPAQPSRDYENVIYFLTSWDDNNKTEQARTNTYALRDEIKESDILINFDDFKSFYYQNQVIVGTTGGRSLNFEALILHELGHLLGLKHDDNNNGSVMATLLPAMTDRVNLNKTDIESMQCEYN